MARRGDHSITIIESVFIWAQRESEMSNPRSWIKERLVELMTYWPEWKAFLASKRGQQPVIIQQAPPMPEVAPMQQWGTPIPEQQPAYVGALPPAPEEQMWKPPEYTPPAGEDPGQPIQLQFGPQNCWQCRPVQQIANGDWADMRTNRFGVKEYRHLYHCQPQRIEPIQQPLPPY